MRWNSVELTGTALPLSEKPHESAPRVNEPESRIGIGVLAIWPVMVPLIEMPPPHSAENVPEISVAVWVVIAHWKFEQLDRSGSVVIAAVDTEPGVTALVERGFCMTQVPRNEDVDADAVLDAMAAVSAIFDGPITVEVRSTPQAVTARAVTSELNKISGFFMRFQFSVSADTPAADTD